MITPVEISAGNIKTRNANILVRANGKAYQKEHFAKIPVIRSADGAIVFLGDIATIKDGFEDLDLKTLFNGQPSMSLSVYRSGNESAVYAAKQVREYIKNKRMTLPDSVQLNY